MPENLILVVKSLGELFKLAYFAPRKPKMAKVVLPPPPNDKNSSYSLKTYTNTTY
jgi:hypothetical protein